MSSLEDGRGGWLHHVSPSHLFWNYISQEPRGVVTNSQEAKGNESVGRTGGRKDAGSFSTSISFSYSPDTHKSSKTGLRGALIDGIGLNDFVVATSLADESQPWLTGKALLRAGATSAPLPYTFTGFVRRPLEVSP